MSFFLTTITLFFRNLFRTPSYSLTTIAGLVVGITTAILTFLWVSYEVSYNRIHRDTDRVYVLLANEHVNGEVVTGDEIPVPFDFLINEIPEVEAATRIDNTLLKLSSDSKAIQKRGVFADSIFFQVHHTEILTGDEIKPLPDNHSIAISKNTADLLFENGDALGKTIFINQQQELKVSAVYNSYPTNSDLRHIEFVLPFHAKARDAEDVWNNVRLKLYSTGSVNAVEEKINGKLKEVLGNDGNITSLLFCMNDWRLYWSFENGKQSGGRYVYVIIFTISGLFILVMACINYMNISTARATLRAREIGVRKMTGATQTALIRQFFTESMLMVIIATFISLGASYFLLPTIKQFTGAQLSLSLSNPVLFTGLLGIALFTGLLAGSYPALVLASFKPAAVIKGKLYSSVSGGGLRKLLVTFQFTISVVMIFCSLIMWQQTNYLLKKDLGYDKQNIINVWLDGSTQFPLENIKADLTSHTSIESAAFGGASPMEINGWSEGNRLEDPLPNPVMLYSANIDKDFLSVLKFEVIQGRNFSPDIASDSSNFIITEKAAEVLGFKNPIGQKIYCNAYSEQTGEIIGVIKDFHHNDIHEAINPVILIYGKTDYLANLFVRYKPEKLEPALSHLKSIYKKYAPDKELNYSLLDSDFENQFHTEKLFKKLSIIFTIIAIIISSIGLFSLALFNTQRRTKEIGIRKVLGASVQQIIISLNKDFLVPVMISFLIAFPLAYYLMSTYLEVYPFRIAISVFSFLIVGSVMVVMILLTTSYHSFKIATKNPTDSLKSE
jgi:ABC-type antimicrobial peptide transport system permease subunit